MSDRRNHWRSLAIAVALTISTLGAAGPAAAAAPDDAATDGLSWASAPKSSTNGLSWASAPKSSTNGLSWASAPKSSTNGLSWA